MTVSLPGQDTRVHPVRLRGLVLAATFAWVVGYSLNGSFWDWVMYDLVGLDSGSRLGEPTR